MNKLIYLNSRPKTERVSIGTIAGRHPMPVDFYLVETPDGKIEVGQPAYELLFKAAVNLPLDRSVPVDLYYTGLTEATWGATDGFEATGRDYQLFMYNLETQTYTPLVRRR